MDAERGRGMVGVRRSADELDADNPPDAIGLGAGRLPSLADPLAQVEVEEFRLSREASA